MSKPDTNRTAPTPTPTAGGSYRLDGSRLTPVKPPTKPAQPKAKRARFVNPTQPPAAKPKAASTTPTAGDAAPAEPQNQP